MPGIEDPEIARRNRALERIVSSADEYGDITGVSGLAEIARRALAGEDITALPAALDTDQPDLNGTDHRASYVLASFIVTEDGERQHPMDVSVVKLNLSADGQPDDASMTDLAHRVNRAALRKVRTRRAPTSPAGPAYTGRAAAWPGPCTCECQHGGFCGGCGHAGCGRR